MTDGKVIVTAKAVTVSGDGAANSLSGTGAADLIHGYDGNDDIDTLGLGDLVYGGLGDDEFEIGDTSFARIDDGDGTDTLRLTGNSLSLTGLRGDKLEGIEAVDLGDGDGVGRTLTLDDILIGAATDGDDILTIDGDSSDYVNLGSSGATTDWTSSIGATYTTYTHVSGVVAEIDNDINTTLL
jgi:hypothetical protein